MSLVAKALRDEVETPRQRGQQVTALHRNLIESPRRHVAFGAIHRDLVAEGADRLQRRVMRIEHTRHAVQIEKRLGEQRHLGGQPQPVLEREVDHLEQDLARLHLRRREVHVASR